MLGKQRGAGPLLGVVRVLILPHLQARRDLEPFLVQSCDLAMSCRAQ
jgi:hypothetical protein